jgi:hypothetical protein
MIGKIGGRKGEGEGGGGGGGWGGTRGGCHRRRHAAGRDDFRSDVAEQTEAKVWTNERFRCGM